MGWDEVSVAVAQPVDNLNEKGTVPSLTLIVSPVTPVVEPVETMGSDRRPSGRVVERLSRPLPDSDQAEDPRLPAARTPSAGSAWVSSSSAASACAGSSDGNATGAEDQFASTSRRSSPIRVRVKQNKLLVVRQQQLEASVLNQSPAHGATRSEPGSG